MSKPRLLDLFCGAGGAAMGYYRAGFEVVGVDIALQKHYLFEFHQADAMTCPLDGFDAIHASPVCKGYTQMNSSGKAKHPLLIPATIERLRSANVPWVIENVEGAISELPSSIVLCGSHFGLQVRRHRLFQSNILLFAPPVRCDHSRCTVGVYGHHVWDSSRRGTVRSDGRHRPGIGNRELANTAMGIDWMPYRMLTQAIPPAYTEWLGRQLLAAIEYASSPAMA